MDASSREHFQQAIDLEIKSLEESIQVLKSRRNAYSAVSSLPPEVFAAIFSTLCLPGTSSLDGKPDTHLAQVVSHVCHQWREIVLNQPLLWSHVNFATLSPVGAAEMLVRAKSTPLFFEASLYGIRHNDVRFFTFRRELQARLPYLRQLRTTAGRMDLDETFKEIVSPAPTLEYLSLSSHGIRKNRLKWGRSVIPDALFNGSTPRLSCLELSYCNISWKSPLLKGLKYLKILTPSKYGRPKLADWLGALDEMSQLVTLTLHSASPIAPSVQFDVERTVTLPSLTRLDILANLDDCALALAHLDLPALTWLCLAASSLSDNSDFQQLLPHVARHAHGPHDTQPLQSMLICRKHCHVNILAWSLPDVDVEVHDPPTLLSMTRVALSFRSNDWIDCTPILDKVMAVLPLDGLVTLATHDDNTCGNFPTVTQSFWLHFSPKWPLLKRVRLSRHVARGFIEMLLEDDGGRERPLLPSLTELTLVGCSPSCELSTLYDTLMKRVEQGVPMEMLHLSMCDCCESWFQSLTEIVVDILGPEESTGELEQSMWETVARGPFDIHNESGDERYW